MKLASYILNGSSSFGIVTDLGIAELNTLQTEVGATLQQMLARWSPTTVATLEKRSPSCIPATSSSPAPPAAWGRFVSRPYG